VTLQVTADAAGRRRKLAPALRRRGLGRQVARTAAYNVATAATAGPCGSTDRGRPGRRDSPLTVSLIALQYPCGGGFLQRRGHALSAGQPGSLHGCKE
jgi:hypothetical protein